jgi:hypothetical protein
MPGRLLNLKKMINTRWRRVYTTSFLGQEPDFVTKAAGQSIVLCGRRCWFPVPVTYRSV